MPQIITAGRRTPYIDEVLQRRGEQRADQRQIAAEDRQMEQRLTLDQLDEQRWYERQRYSEDQQIRAEQRAAARAAGKPESADDALKRQKTLVQRWVRGAMSGQGPQRLRTADVPLIFPTDGSDEIEVAWNPDSRAATLTHYVDGNPVGDPNEVPADMWESLLRRIDYMGKVPGAEDGSGGAAGGGGGGSPKLSPTRYDVMQRTQDGWVPVQVRESRDADGRPTKLVREDTGEEFDPDGGDIYRASWKEIKDRGTGALRAFVYDKIDRMPGMVAEVDDAGKVTFVPAKDIEVKGQDIQAEKQLKIVNEYAARMDMALDRALRRDPRLMLTQMDVAGATIGVLDEMFSTPEWEEIGNKLVETENGSIPYKALLALQLTRPE